MIIPKDILRQIIKAAVQSRIFTLGELRVLCSRHSSAALMNLSAKFADVSHDAHVRIFQAYNAELYTINADGTYVGIDNSEEVQPMYDEVREHLASVDALAEAMVEQPALVHRNPNIDEVEARGVGEMISPVINDAQPDELPLVRVTAYITHCHGPNAPRVFLTAEQRNNYHNRHSGHSSEYSTVEAVKQGNRIWLFQSDEPLLLNAEELQKSALDKLTEDEKIALGLK